MTLGRDKGNHLENSSVTLIGIGGGTGSGKTTLASLLSDALGGDSTVTISTDNYYLSNDTLKLSERERLNYDDPKAIDFSLLEKHLRELVNGRAIKLPVYDYASHTRSRDVIDLSPKPFVILEGIFALFQKGIRDLCRYTIFVDATEELRFDRRLNRDTKERGRTEEGVHEQWNATVKSGHDAFCEPTSNLADVVVDGSNLTAEIANSLAAKIKNASGTASHLG